MTINMGRLNCDRVMLLSWCCLSFTFISDIYAAERASERWTQSSERSTWPAEASPRLFASSTSAAVPPIPSGPAPRTGSAFSRMTPRVVPQGIPQGVSGLVGGRTNGFSRQGSPGANSLSSEEVVLPPPSLDMSATGRLKLVKNLPAERGNRPARERPALPSVVSGSTGEAATKGQENKSKSSKTRRSSSIFSSGTEADVGSDAGEERVSEQVSGWSQAVVEGQPRFYQLREQVLRGELGLVDGNTSDGMAPERMTDAGAIGDTERDSVREQGERRRRSIGGASSTRQETPTKNHAAGSSSSKGPRRLNGLHFSSEKSHLRRKIPIPLDPLSPKIIGGGSSGNRPSRPQPIVRDGESHNRTSSSSHLPSTDRPSRRDQSTSGDLSFLSPKRTVRKDIEQDSGSLFCDSPPNPPSVKILGSPDKRNSSRLQRPPPIDTTTFSRPFGWDPPSTCRPDSSPVSPIDPSKNFTQRRGSSIVVQSARAVVRPRHNSGSSSGEDWSNWEPRAAANTASHTTPATLRATARTENDASKESTARSSKEPVVDRNTNKQSAPSPNSIRQLVNSVVDRQQQQQQQTSGSTHQHTTGIGIGGSSASSSSSTAVVPQTSTDFGRAERNMFGLTWCPQIQKIMHREVITKKPVTVYYEEEEQDVYTDNGGSGDIHTGNGGSIGGSSSGTNNENKGERSGDNSNSGNVDLQTSNTRFASKQQSGLIFQMDIPSGTRGKVVSLVEHAVGSPDGKVFLKILLFLPRKLPILANRSNHSHSNRQKQTGGQRDQQQQQQREDGVVNTATSLDLSIASDTPMATPTGGTPMSKPIGFSLLESSSVNGTSMGTSMVDFTKKRSRDGYYFFPVRDGQILQDFFECT